MPLRTCCMAPWALRPGRYPWEQSRKSASKMGSRISLAAVCTTRSLTVGIPRGRVFPFALGISTRRMEVGMKKTDLVLEMLRRARNQGVEADAVLFDSWYCYPK